MLNLCGLEFGSQVNRPVSPTDQTIFHFRLSKKSGGEVDGDSVDGVKCA